MKLFDKPFGEYFQFVKVGLYLLALVAVVRFLMKPVFNIPYAQGTHFTSVTILLPILMIVYTIRANSAGLGSYRDLLGIAAVFGLSSAVLIILGIAISNIAGIETYYIEPGHGGGINQWFHAGAHLILNGVIFGLILWGIGSLVNFLMSMGRKKAVA